MEQTNTIDNKARFFAQYLDQRIYCIVGWNRGAMILDNDKLIKDKYLDKAFLELKSLQSITDEDAIEVASMLRPPSFEMHPRGWKIARTKKEIEITHRQSVYEFDIDFDGTIGVDNGESWEYLSNAVLLHVYDYLRSKGYALPYLGVSVEQQIEWNWIKLKTD